MAEERLQKLLAQAGLGSRRGCEQIITSGRVTVNGVPVTELGSKADPDVDEVRVDGKLLRFPTKKIYIMLNKPAGYVTANSDPDGRPTVIDLLPGEFRRVFHVGRLDYDTEGLLLLTDDGDFCQAVMHPSQKVVKVYEANVEGIPEEANLEKLRRGIELDDGMTAPSDVTLIKTRKAGIRKESAVLRIGIREGRKRQVRRMFAAIGHPVFRLRRIRIGKLKLGDLKTGQYRVLTREEASLAMEKSSFHDK